MSCLNCFGRCTVLADHATSGVSCCHATLFVDGLVCHSLQHGEDLLRRAKSATCRVTCSAETPQLDQTETTPCSEKKWYILFFQLNFTTTGSIFLQFSMTITK